MGDTSSCEVYHHHTARDASMSVCASMPACQACHCARLACLDDELRLPRRRGADAGEPLKEPPHSDGERR